MSSSSREKIERNLHKYKKEYVDSYRVLESTNEFRDLSRSARGTGMLFQYHQSVRDAIVERAKEAGKQLRQGIYDKVTKEQPDLINNLEATISEAKKYLETSNETYQETAELREMLRTIEGYLPEQET